MIDLTISMVSSLNGTPAPLSDSRIFRRSSHGVIISETVVLAAIAARRDAPVSDLFFASRLLKSTLPSGEKEEIHEIFTEDASL